MFPMPWRGRRECQFLLTNFRVLVCRRRPPSSRQFLPVHPANMRAAEAPNPKASHGRRPTPATRRAHLGARKARLCTPTKRACLPSLARLQAWGGLWCAWSWSCTAPGETRPYMLAPRRSKARCLCRSAGMHLDRKPEVHRRCKRQVPGLKMRPASSRPLFGWADGPHRLLC
jgi:hypothetical protein